jgi:hypothetical protein
MKLIPWQISLILSISLPAVALPPPADFPEEYLRNQIIVEARSPLDGGVISAGEYADFMARLAKETNDQADRVVVGKYRETVFLLRLRRLLLNFGIKINPN